MAAAEKLLPYSYNLSQIQFILIDLGNEDGSNRLVQRSAVHVDGGPDREHEPRHASVNAVVLQQTLEGDGQGG